MEQLSMFEEAALAAMAQAGDSVTLNDIQRELGCGWTVRARENWVPADDQWGDWDVSLNQGRSYMVGCDTPMSQYLKRYTSPMTAWQKLAWRWAMQNPDRLVTVRGDRCRREWDVFKRGDHVELCLPYHDMGGERAYISKDGRTKVHVDED